jgi:5-methylcytosine-specific restriction endonuclease McrA
MRRHGLKSSVKRVNVDKKELETLISQGLSSEEIGKLLGCSGRQIRHYLRRYGLQTQVRYRGYENLTKNRHKAIETMRRRCEELREARKKTCEFCGRVYVVRRKCLIEKSRFCSNECKYAWMDTLEGEKHWNYKGKNCLLKRLGTKYYKWRGEILKRDNYTCQVCGRGRKQGIQLHVHHLNSFAHNEDGRLDVNNGVTLCKDCHRKFHKFYGHKSGNTKEQFDEFVKNYSSQVLLTVF